MLLRVVSRLVPAHLRPPSRPQNCQKLLLLNKLRSRQVQWDVMPPLALIIRVYFAIEIASYMQFFMSLLTTSSSGGTVVRRIHVVTPKILLLRAMTDMLK